MSGAKKKVEIHHGLKGEKGMIYWNPKKIKELKEKGLKIKIIGGAIDESTPYMDNYCHQINFKINEKEYTIDLTDMDIVNTYNV